MIHGGLVDLMMMLIIGFVTTVTTRHAMHASAECEWLTSMIHANVTTYAENERNVLLSLTNCGTVEPWAWVPKSTAKSLSIFYCSKTNIISYLRTQSPTFLEIESESVSSSCSTGIVLSCKSLQQGGAHLSSKKFTATDIMSVPDTNQYTCYC